MKQIQQFLFIIMLLINCGWNRLNLSRIPFYQFLTTQPGQIIKQVDQMIIFNNLDNLKLGQPIISNNSLGIIMSIFEKQSVALLLNQGNADREVKGIDQLYCQYKFPFSLSNVNAKDGERLELPKILNHTRTNRGQQLYTGNIFIDLFHPITDGQLLLFKSEKLLDTLKDYDEIVTYSNKELKLKLPNVTQFKSNNELNSDYILPKLALQYAYNQSKNKRTLLIVDSIYQHMIAYQKIQEVILSYLYDQHPKTVYLSDYVKQLSNYCGHQQNKHNLTIAILYQNDQENALNIELEKEIESMISQEVNQSVQLPTPMNKQIQSPLMYYLAQELYKILNNYELKKQEYIMKQKLKMHIDPWDFYQYLDCIPIIKMINQFNKQQNDEAQMVLFVYWLIRIYKDEIICQLKNDYNIQDVIEFANTFTEFNNSNFFDLYQVNKANMEPNEFKKFILENLERFFELHTLHLRMNDLLLPFKRDYMNESQE